jgi:FKBP-type peptidyl-prolyl cis-trans isomerase (trigger factor)
MKKVNKKVIPEDYSVEKFNNEFFQIDEFQKDYPEVKNIAQLKQMISEFIDMTYVNQAQIEKEKKLKKEIANAIDVEKIEGFVKHQTEAKVRNYLQKFKDLGIEADKFLTEQNINLDQLKTEWSEEITTDVKFELALAKHASDQGFEVKPEELDSEYAKLDAETKKHYNNDEALLRYIITYQLKNIMAYKNIEKLVYKK